MAWTTVGNIRGPAGPTGPQGPEGPQGDPGPAAPAGLNWQGAWDTDTTYAAGDAVGWSGSSYFALDPPPAQGTAPTSGADDTAVNTGWALLAVEGATGPQGPQGTQGAQGAQGPQGNTGPQGLTGPAGDTGPTGATGARGSMWFVGTGAPTSGNTPGALPGDQYLDGTNGDVYTLS